MSDELIDYTKPFSNVEDAWNELESVDAILTTLSIADVSSLYPKHITSMMITMSSKICKATRLLKEAYAPICAGAKALKEKDEKESSCSKS